MRKLADSIYLENIQEVKSILENEPNLIDEKDEHGVLMALLAAKTGNLELVKYIVEYSRASMNIHDDNILIPKLYVILISFFFAFKIVIP